MDGQGGGWTVTAPKKVARKKHMGKKGGGTERGTHGVWKSKKRDD